MAGVRVAELELADYEADSSAGVRIADVRLADLSPFQYGLRIATLRVVSAELETPVWFMRQDDDWVPLATFIL